MFRRWVKPSSALVVGGYDSNFVCIVACQVGIDEDKKVGYRLGEGESFLEYGPGMRIGIDHDGKERWGKLCIICSSLISKYCIGRGKTSSRNS